MTTSEPQVPPVTGVDAIDKALAQVDLSGDVSLHGAQLAGAIEVLQQELNGSGQRSPG